MSGVVVATLNGGDTWKVKKVPQGPDELAGITCPSATTCYAVGLTGTVDGSIVVTTNSGAT
jgi:hypothetical protein